MGYNPDPAARITEENDFLRELALDLADAARNIAQDLAIRTKRAAKDPDFLTLVAAFNETSLAARRAAILLLRARRPDRPIAPNVAQPIPDVARAPAAAPSRPDHEPRERLEPGDAPETLADDEHPLSATPAKALAAIVADLRRVRDELGPHAPPGADRRLRTLEVALADGPPPSPKPPKPPAPPDPRKPRPPPDG